MSGKIFIEVPVRSNQFVSYKSNETLKGIQHPSLSIKEMYREGGRLDVR
jgi:hypothetical protein